MHKGRWVVMLTNDVEGTITLAPDMGECWPHALDWAWQCVRLNKFAGTPCRASVFKIPADLETLATLIGERI